MDSRFVSGASSPSLSFSISRASSASDVLTTPDSVGTPGTDALVLFDDVPMQALDAIREEETYILVVGGLGYIGSHTTLELLKEGYNVIVVDDLSNAYRDVLDRVETLASQYRNSIGKPMPTIKFHEADYKSPVMRSILSSYVSKSPFATQGRPQVSMIKGAIHFAAFKSVEESINNPLPYYNNNVCGMVNFLSLLQEFGIKNFVFSSSATVYGSKANQGTPLREEHCVHENTAYTEVDGSYRMTESGVFGLTSPYGRTKWMCEAILADVARSDPTWTITALRYFNPVGCHESGLLGEDPRQKPTNLVPVVVRVLTGASPQLNINGTDYDTLDGTAVRDFIHVVDLARGHIAALAAAAKGNVRQPFRTYNLGTGTGHTVREVVASLEKASGRNIPTQEVGRRPGDVGFCVAGVDRASEELEWKTEKTLDDCTRDVWNFTERSGRAPPAAKKPLEPVQLQPIQLQAVPLPVL